MAPRLSVVFRRLVRVGSFPACWRQANVTSIPKGPPSSSVTNYRPISITSVSGLYWEATHFPQWAFCFFFQKKTGFLKSGFLYKKNICI